RSRLERVRERLTAYDGEIRYMDEQLGRLLDALRAAGRLDDALVVVAGDHGEGLGEHGHLEHGLVWDCELHAPLLMRVPGEAPRRVDTLVTAADVLPTLFGRRHVAGSEAFAEQFSGVDVLAGPPDRDGILSMSSDRQLTLG